MFFDLSRPLLKISGKAVGLAFSPVQCIHEKADPWIPKRGSQDVRVLDENFYPVSLLSLKEVKNVVADSRGRRFLWTTVFFSSKSGTCSRSNTVCTADFEKARTGNNFGFQPDPVGNLGFVQNLSPEMCFDRGLMAGHPRDLHESARTV